jgi:hypothetical protein
MSPFDSWENFYIIVGSSAGALTGLQFVVITLIADSRRLAKGLGEVNAFGTPTVVHFCSVLLLGAVVSAPWPRTAEAAGVLTLMGVAGLVYMAVVIRRALRQKGYQPVFEDWVWHTILPVLAYLGLLAGGIVLLAHPTTALFMMGGAALVLLFDGIHNAWDTVIYVAVVEGQEGAGEGRKPRRS